MPQRQPVRVRHAAEHERGQGADDEQKQGDNHEDGRDRLRAEYAVQTPAGRRGTVGLRRPVRCCQTLHPCRAHRGLLGLASGSAGVLGSDLDERVVKIEEKWPQRCGRAAGDADTRAGFGHMAGKYHDPSRKGKIIEPDY